MTKVGRFRPARFLAALVVALVVEFRQVEHVTECRPVDNLSESPENMGVMGAFPRSNPTLSPPRTLT